MKILLYAPNYLPATRYGGPIRSSHGLSRALVGLGHEVTVFTTNVDGLGVLDVPLDRTVNIHGVSVRYFPVTRPRQLFRSPAMRNALLREITHFDVAYTNGVFLWPGPIVGAAARRAQVPYVVAPRGMLVPELIARRSPLIKRAWICLLERRNLAGAARIHATAELEASDIRRLGLDLAHIAIVPNGVEAPDPPPTYEAAEAFWQGIPAGYRVAFLARLDWKKGADLAIDVVTALPNVHLWIAGHDQIGLRAELEARAATSGRSTAVRFLGPVNGADKWAFLAGADILIMPSISENFGIAAAEALLVGTPVVCTDGVGAAEIVRKLDPGCVVPRNREALTAAISSLVANDSRRKLYGQRAKELMAERFTWPNIATQMEEVFHQVLAERGASLDRQRQARATPARAPA